ncbi:trypsin-like [Phlebotomus papatasi]|uniref:trypsin-like n=1 Tax=Phlebotomus papatasi TaxID=29031 RepID=UPI0024837E0C|nr:trypsin-like [Phlebotomus papatasi]
MKQIVLALFFIFLTGKAFSAETFIVGGEDAQAGQFPWIGGIEYVEYAFVCAGAVISDHWFLTAAHCVYFLTPDAIRIRVGSRFRETGGQLHDITRHITHPNFTQDYTYEFDVAVCETAGIMAGPGIRPVPVGQIEPPTGSRVFISGWGATEYGGYPAEVLQFVDIPIISRDDCNIIYPGNITESMICAGQSGRDVCVLDNGGPMASFLNFFSQFELTLKFLLYSLDGFQKPFGGYCKRWIGMR